jgi:hypothetical protein
VQAQSRWQPQEFPARVLCTLDELTRTPFLLSEVTALFRSGVPIPRTKLALLRAVVELMERSEEHAGQLQAPPIRGLAQHYLCSLAMHLTARGDVLLAEPEARSICHSTSDSLGNAGQITVTPEPADILNVLTSHHILERIDYPGTSFRFEHQQFQEYYSALVLEDELRRWSHREIRLVPTHSRGHTSMIHLGRSHCA